MENTQPRPINRPQLKVVRPGRSTQQIVHLASPEASAAEVEAAVSSCVNHLCGCN